MAFRHMTDLRRSDEDKEEAMEPAPASLPDVPYGLCICLTEEELEKLDLDDECAVGDLIHGFFMAQVTGISKNDTGQGPKCRIELAITHLGLEDEDTEEEPD